MIVVFGGSFDPVHCGHVAMADAVQEFLQPKRLLWVPSRHAPHKPLNPPAAAAQRLALLHAVVGSRPGEHIHALELERAGPSYSVDTLRALQQEFPAAKLGFLLGADSLSHLNTWRDLPQLFTLVEFLFVPREGWNEVSLELFRHALAPSLQVLFRARFITMNKVAASSTAIRAELNRGILSAAIPAQVAALIRAGGYYGCSP